MANTTDSNEKKIVLTKEEQSAKEYLLDLLCSITDKDEMSSLLDDLLTQKEHVDIIQRYLLMDDLYKGISQRDIASKRKMSLCKITRGSRMLKKKNGYMKKLLSSRYDDHTHI